METNYATSDHETVGKDERTMPMLRLTYMLFRTYNDENCMDYLFLAKFC